MDFFKFENQGYTPGGDSNPNFERATFLSDVESYIWVERYQRPSSFEIVAPVSSGYKDSVPLGSFVGAMSSLDLMVVESHEIKETIDEDPKITITGRSLTTILEQRVVGANINPIDPYDTGYLDPYYMFTQGLHNVIASTINDHITSNLTHDQDDSLAYIVADSLIPIQIGDPYELKLIERGPLSERVLELLKEGDYGLRAIRPNEYGEFDSSTEKLKLAVHKGRDKSREVVFSYDSGDLTEVHYFWTNKGFRTSALVIGKFTEVVVNLPGEHLDRRRMFINAQDIENGYTEPPMGADLISVQNLLTKRGEQILKAQSEVNISSVDVSAQARYNWRVDYDIGDIVTVVGNFGTSQKMRVVEYVESSDLDGEVVSHPVLSTLKGEP